MELTHLNERGEAHMVDVSAKEASVRTARAAGRVELNADTFRLLADNAAPKGDVLAAARIAGIMAAKHTSDLIPLCHPIALTGIEVELRLNAETTCVEILAAARCTGPTGVEMEALTAVSAAALTVYDMCKAVQRDIVIRDICLLEKDGGRSGHFVREGVGV